MFDTSKKKVNEAGISIPLNLPIELITVVNFFYQSHLSSIQYMLHIMSYQIVGLIN